MTRTRGIAVFLSFLTVSAFAQMRENITVELVEVPVYVTAPDGNPVRGLKKEAFALKVDGKPQPVEYFEEIDFGSAAPAAAPAMAAAPKNDLRQRRLYLLVFDLYFNQAKRLTESQKAAEEIVARSEPSDLFSVATFTSRSGLQFVTPFLNDRPAIRRAIATLAPSGAKDTLGLATLKAERTEINIQALVETSDLGGGRGGSEVASMLVGGRANVEAMGEPLRRSADQQIAGLAGAAERMRGLEGQKHVVLLGAGYGTVFSNAPSRYQKDVAQLQRAFNDAGVFLDAIDTAGVPAMSEVGGLSRAYASDSLRQLTEATGGKLIQGENDVAQAFTRLSTAQRTVYLLAFKRRNNGEGTIEVSVSGAPKGSRVAYRTGYGKPEKGGEIDNLQLADIVENDIAERGVSLVIAERAASGGAELAISFPTAEVVPQIVPKSEWVDLMLYIFDEHGAAALTKSLRMPFDPAKNHAPRAGVHQTVPLPPGRYTVKALLHIGGTQSVGFAKREIVVH